MRRLAAATALLAAACAGPTSPTATDVAAGVDPTTTLAANPGAYEVPPTTVPPPPPPPPTTVPKRASRGETRQTPPPPTGDVWSALGACESGNNPRSVSSTGKYRGAFQFSIATWQSLGYGGDPIEASYEVQLQAAQKLQERSGWGQWPSCSKQLGLV